MYFASYCKNCKKSSHCCIFEDGKGFTFVTPSDARVIAKETGLSYAEFLNYSPLAPKVIAALKGADEMREGALRATQVDSSGRILRLKQQANGRCVFLRDDGKCGIYHIRPNICRIYPFWAMELIDGRIKVIRHDTIPTCPIVKAMEKKDKDIETILSQRHADELRSLFSSILAEIPIYKKEIKAFVKEAKLL